MAALDHFDSVQRIYNAFYQRPAEPAGLLYWARQLDAAQGNLSGLIDAFANSAEAVQLFFPDAKPGDTLYSLLNAGNIGQVIDAVYQALFGRAADAAGKAFFVQGFERGQFTAGTITLNVLDGAQGTDRDSVNHKGTASRLFTQSVDGRDYAHASFGQAAPAATFAGAADVLQVRQWLAGVGLDPRTLPDLEAIASFVRNLIADPGDPIQTAPRLTQAPSLSTTSPLTLSFAVGSDSGSDLRLLFEGQTAEPLVNGQALSIALVPGPAGDAPRQGVYEATDGKTTLGVARVTLGTVGADRLEAIDRPFAGVVLGFGGDDVLQGRAGPETLDGGAGGDSLLGGAGNDVLRGGEDTANLLAFQAGSPGARGYFQDVQLQADGRLLTAGLLFNHSAGTRLAVVRFEADGQAPDLRFGQAGLASVGFSVAPPNEPRAVDEFATPLLLLRNGKIVVALEISPEEIGQGGLGQGLRTLLVRFHADGTLDSSFGQNGKAPLLYLPPVGDNVRDLVELPDGSIAVLSNAFNVTPGSTSNTGRFAVQKVLANGMVDGSYGTSGAGASVDFGDRAERPSAMAVQANGQILIAGRVPTQFVTEAQDFGVARLTTSGILDTSFGLQGRVIVPVGSGEDELRDIAVQADGKILLAGTVYGPGTADAGVVRLLSDGTLDSSFGQGGKAIIAQSSPAFVQKVLVDGQGRILVAGHRASGNGDFFALRLQTDGRLDLGFGERGIATIDFGGAEVLGGLALDAAGRIVLSGSSLPTGRDGREAVIGRLLDDGRPDPQWVAHSGDTLAGGTGNDTLSGGNGADDFQLAYGTGAGHDVWLDFSTRAGDRIDFTGLSDIRLATDPQSNRVGILPSEVPNIIQHGFTIATGVHASRDTAAEVAKALAALRLGNPGEVAYLLLNVDSSDSLLGGGAVLVRVAEPTTGPRGITAEGITVLATLVGADVATFGPAHIAF